jgi:hypothetical protein
VVNGSGFPVQEPFGVGTGIHLNIERNITMAVIRLSLLMVLTAFIAGCAAPHILTDDERTFSITMMAQPTTFTLPKTQSEDAWGRANVFVSQYSDMRIQSATNYTISTFGPLAISQYGYEISRTPLGDSATFSVTCNWFAGNVFSNQQKEAAQNAHAAAYFIATGKINPIFVYH